MGVFHFKRFSVCDDHATMKVGTDAVLLGAWANVEKADRVLDIGTGTGILALMLAQRTTENTHIDAVELSEPDARQASENARQSSWSGNISVFHSDIQEFKPSAPYDCIVCNPPFFINSLLPPLKSRQTSRHTTALTQDELIDVSRRLLTPAGRLNIILPFAESEIFISKARERNLALHRYTRFFSRRTKPQERSLLEFRFNEGPLVEDDLVLYQSGSEWTKEYHLLTRDFYLDKQE